MKKGEMGVGTLIIFIAMLLVAAVAAGVLIQTVSSLQEKSLSTGIQAESQISTHAETVEVSASDGRQGNLTDFQQIVKLAPGSDPIKLSQMVFTFNTKDETGTLKYRGVASICEKNNINGFNTRSIELDTDGMTNAVNSHTLTEDLDDDGANDYVYVLNVSGNDFLAFNLSTEGWINVSLATNIDGAGGAVSITDSAVNNGTTTLATVTVSGNGANGVLSSGTVITITPSDFGEGYFSAIFEQQSTNWIDGTMQRGDIVRFCYEAPRAVNEDEEVRLNLIPKIGTATLTQFATPDVISTERVYLYP